MIKTFLKHMVAEHALNALFDKVQSNFTSKSNRIRKLTIKLFRSEKDFTNNKHYTIIICEVGKHQRYFYDDGNDGWGSAVIDKIEIQPIPSPLAPPRWGFVHLYRDGILWNSQQEVLDTMEIEYF